jgi:PAS domain S-box-containing protein
MSSLTRPAQDTPADSAAAEAAGSALEAGPTPRRRVMLPWLVAMSSSRLCQRVALAIFLCLIAVATIFLVPAYRDLEGSLLMRLEQSSLASVVSLSRLMPKDAGPDHMIAAASVLVPGTPLLGGTLYGRDGSVLGGFGERPDLVYLPGVTVPEVGRYAVGRSRYDVAWMGEQTGSPYVFVARLDSSWIGPQLEHFLVRVGLVSLVMVLAVTGVTMGILGLTVLAPILELRHRLAAAGGNLEHADRHTIPVARRDELGDVLGDFNALLGHVARSIADLRRSHEEVRESEERWHKIFDGSADAILILDAESHRIIDANETALKLFEYGRADLLRLPLAMLDGDAPALDHMVEAAGALGRAGSEALVCVSRSGRRILAEAQLSTLPIGPRRPILLMVRDMTERRLAEEALRMSQRRLAGILDIAQDAIISVDDTRCVRLFNKGAECVFGYAAHEVIGRPLDLLLPDGSAMVQEMEQRSWDGGTASLAERTEVRVRRKDGSEFPAELSASKFRLGDESVFTIILRDISERRRAELERAQLLGQFHQAQKMEAIGRLAGGIAHDFNNILAAILGYADLALCDISEANPAHANMEQVLKAGRRGKTLVRQILAFSRREEKIRQRVELDQVLHETMDLLSATLPKTIQVEHSMTDEPTPVMGDEAELHQLIMNLCVNAAQAIGQEPGVIGIALETVEMAADDIAAIAGAGAQLVVGRLEPGWYVRLSLSDTGIGMDEDTVTRMFEPFFTTKPKGEGTGLGLAAVHGIVTGQDGAIAVRSAPGHGTRIDVFLRRCEDARNEAAKPESLSVARGERVLLVDDEPDLTHIGRHALERAGYRVDTAASAAAALELFRAGPDRWSVVVTDHMMPGMTGEAMAREMLRVRPGLSIVMCTGYGQTITSESARAAGIRGFVLKPVSGRELAAVVRRLLDAGRGGEAAAD